MVIVVNTNRIQNLCSILFYDYLKNIEEMDEVVNLKVEE